MKASHFKAPRQLDDAVFYSAQTSEPVAYGLDQFPVSEFLVALVGALCIVGVLAAVALGVI